MKNITVGFLFALNGVAFAAIDINVGRQLFVDDFLVDSTQGVVRVYNHPTKAFDAPVMWAETDLEREVDPKRPYRFAPVAGATSGGLWWDPVKKVFRLWYEAGWMKYLCYAESKDGITWERKDLGIVKGTNRVLTDTLLDSWSVFPDYKAENPYANWRMMVSVAGGVTDNRLYTSSDGIAWTHIGNAGQSGDRSTMFYDPFRGKGLSPETVRAGSRRYLVTRHDTLPRGGIPCHCLPQMVSEGTYATLQVGTSASADGTCEVVVGFDVDDPALAGAMTCLNGEAPTEAPRRIDGKTLGDKDRPCAVAYAYRFPVGVCVAGANAVSMEAMETKASLTWCEMRIK